METEQELCKALCIRVENFTGFRMETRRHFDVLSDRIYTSTRSFLSPTTLRRFFGYQEKGGTFSQNTLNVLCRYLGYEGWEDYKQKCQSGEEDASDFIRPLRTLSVETLQCGDIVCVTWAPERTVRVEFLGDDAFRVLESVNSKLRKDDTFHCKQFVEGMPLFCSSLLRVGSAAMSYVCGKLGGIHFSLQQ